MVTGLPQRLAITISLLLNIRIRARKGFRQALDADLAQRAPRMASGAIGHAVAGDGHQPGKEWALRIVRSEEHTSELQSLMRISYAVFCLNNKNSQHAAH